MAEYRHKSGIYAIEHLATGRVYIGSSADLAQRWYAHKKLLAAGKHHSTRLQRAWNKYGPDAFRFSMLEECDKSDLLVREQVYLDTFTPVFNTCPVAGRPPGFALWSKASQDSFRQLARARAALITHCPRGHLYDEANTYRNARGTPFCRTCAAERTRAVLAAETPEQRDRRIQKQSAYHEANKETRYARMRKYAAARKDEKRAYDQQRAALKAERDRERRMSMTPEQQEARRQSKRDYYAANRETVKVQLAESYRRRHPVPEPPTTCRNGHPYEDGSFRIWRNKKLCQVCRAATKRSYRERTKAKNPT